MSAPLLALPTYGMPCCGHRIIQHSGYSNVFGDTSRCRCCRNAKPFANALVLMADNPPASCCFPMMGEPCGSCHRCAPSQETGVS